MRLVDVFVCVPNTQKICSKTGMDYKSRDIASTEPNKGQVIAGMEYMSQDIAGMEYMIQEIAVMVYRVEART